MSSLSRYCLAVLLWVTVTIALIWGVTWGRQWRHYVKADTYFLDNRPHDALLEYEATIRMFTPGSSMVRRSVEQIWVIGEQFRSSGKNDDALMAFQALKTSLYAIRSFYAPYKEMRDRAERVERDLLQELRQQERVEKETRQSDSRPPEPAAH